MRFILRKLNEDDEMQQLSLDTYDDDPMIEFVGPVK
jgi:hypothetical protein